MKNKCEKSEDEMSDFLLQLIKDININPNLLIKTKK